MLSSENGADKLGGMKRILLVLVFLLTLPALAQTVRINGKEVPYRLVDGKQMVERQALSEAFPGYPAGEGRVDLAEIAKNPKARVMRRDGRIVSIRYYDDRWTTADSSTSSSQGSASQQKIPSSERTLINQIIKYSNQERSKHGVHPLTYHPKLTQAAQGHSEEMRDMRYMDHQSPTHGRETPHKRVLLTGFRPRTVGENLARMDRYDEKALAQATVRDWMNSPPHRKNLLDPDYHLIGIGIARNRYRVYITQVFSSKN